MEPGNKQGLILKPVNKQGLILKPVKTQCSIRIKNYIKISKEFSFVVEEI